jgi:hypothetical protein
MSKKLIANKPSPNPLFFNNGLLKYMHNFSFVAMRKIPIFRAALQSQQDLTFSTFPSHFPCTFKVQERKAPYKRPLKEGHAEGYHQNSLGFLSALRTPHRFLPSVHLILGPWLTLMVPFSSFL